MGSEAPEPALRNVEAFGHPGSSRSRGVQGIGRSRPPVRAAPTDGRDGGDQDRARRRGMLGPSDAAGRLDARDAKYQAERPGGVMMDAMSTQIAGNDDEETLRAGGSRTDTSFMRLPTHRERVTAWLPFAAVALVGQVSAAWPPGPSNVSAFWVSTGLLLALLLVVVVRQHVLPETLLFRVGMYTTSVVFLMIAAGGVSSGLGALLLIPVVGVALYGRRWESACVVALVLGAVLCVSLTTPDLATATGRRLLLFGSISVMFSVAIHALRDRLNLSNERTRRLLCQEKSINDAARQLTMMVDPPAITALGAQLAARMASPAGSEVRRASYLVIEQGVVPPFPGTKCATEGLRGLKSLRSFKLKSLDMFPRDHGLMQIGMPLIVILPRHIRKLKVHVLLIERYFDRSCVDVSLHPVLVFSSPLRIVLVEIKTCVGSNMRKISLNIAKFRRLNLRLRGGLPTASCNRKNYKNQKKFF